VPPPSKLSRLAAAAAVVSLAPALATVIGSATPASAAGATSRALGNATIGLSGGGGTGGSASALRNVNAGRCLDVPHASQTNGVQTELWDCNGGNNQKWTRS
jgi:hypothetical protein